MHLDWTMGIVQAATRLQAAALARQQRIGLLRKIPTLSSCRPFWKYQQQQEPQCHQYELLSLTASTTYPTVEHKRAHHQQQPQPCRSSSNDGSQNVNSSCLAIVLTMYNPIISTQQPAPHLPPIRGMGKALRVAATTPAAARRCFASSSSSLSLPDNGENNSNVVVISESVNDLETKVMRQMAQRLLIQTRHDDDQGKRSANTTTITRYHSHTWFDAEDALKWWASQRTVESVQICFALLDRFVQETAAAAQQQAQQLETDDQQQSPSSSTMNGLAWFLDWRLMGAIMGNWTAVWKECVEDGTTSRSRLELLLTPRVVLERLDRYAQEHAHVTGFGVRASGVILSNVLNVAITQSRSMLGLDGRGGSLATTRPLLGKPPLQPPVTSPATAPASEVATRFQQEQQFSFLTVGNTMNCNSTLINNGENEHDMVEMVQFCTHVLDSLLDEYRHLDNSDGDRGTAHQETSIEHRSKKKSNVRKSSVYFCNSLLSLWSHICSRSNTMADLERAVQQAEYVFSMSLNAGAPLDIISYNTMLDVYAQAEKGHQAESLLQTMFQNWLFHKEQRQEHHTRSSCEQQDEQYSRDHYVVEPDAISFNTTAAAWARSTPSHEAPERLQALWRAMLDPQHYGQLRACRQGTTSNIFYNTLLLTWAKSGRPDAGEGAEEFLREMILRASLASCPSPSSRLSSSRLHPGSVYDDNEEDEEVSLARKQYEQQQPDIVSYGAVAYAYSRVGRAEDAERIALELYQAFSETPPDNVQRRESLRPTTVLLTLVIEAWARSPLTTIRGEDRVARIRAIIDDMNRLYEEGVLSDPPDTWAWNVLLRCIVDVATAAGGGKSSSKEMGERDKPKMLMQEALDLLKIMKKQPDHRARPNAWSYSTIILAFLELHQLQQALELLHQACAVEKINIDIRTIGRVILTAVSKREGGIKEMNQGTIWLHRLFDACEPAAFESNESNRLIYSGGQPAASLVGAVVAGWSRICNRTNNRSHTVAADALLACQEATALMERMRRMYKAGYLAQGPDDGIMRLVVSCWARFSCSDNPHHVKKKAALKALQYLQEIRQMAKTDSDSRTMLPDLVTYNEVLRCLATAQEPLRAEALLKQMIDDYNHRGTDANTAWRITACFNTVLLGWTLVSSPSNADAVSSRAQGVLDAMQRLPISANRETYHHMIGVWSNAGRPDKAENIFYRMKQAYEKDLTNVKNIKNYAKDHRQHEQQASCSTLQPTTHSFRRIIQAWTAMRSNATCSFNPERAERFLLEMYRWFKSGENDKVCPSPECFRSVAQAWSELATTNCPDGEQQRGFRKRAEYILSLSRDLHQSSPASTK